MTPDNLKTLNAILGLHDWAIDAECDDRELADIALQIASATGLPLMDCIRFVASVHATAIVAYAASRPFPRIAGRG